MTAISAQVPAPPADELADRAGDVGGGWTAQRLGVLCALVACGLYAARGAWQDILLIASHDEESSHVWLVPFLAGWLVWLRRAELARVTPRSSLWGVPVIAAGWALSHWGFNAPKQSPFHLGALVVFLGCVLTCVGPRVLKVVWPAVPVLLFLIPVPGMARQRISIPLEQVTANVTAHVLTLFGTSLTRSANVIQINGHPVAVAEACNGLRMAFPLFLIVYVFCFTVPLRNGVRWALLISSPVSAVICNVLRLIPTVLLYGYASKATADKFHEYSGWPMVTVAFLLLTLIIRGLQVLRVPVMRAKREAAEPAVDEATPRGGLWFVGPALAVMGLAAMAFGDRLTIHPEEADGFHAAAAAAINGWPKASGDWRSVKEIPLPVDAEGLLKPNAYLHRLYVNGRTGRGAELLLVQCRDARAMQGHYPPVCYPSSGCKLSVVSADQTWPAGRFTVPGCEYAVTGPDGHRFRIRNFFVLPNGSFCRDMDAVIAAAKNYRELSYGAAQVQVIFDADVSDADRDSAFASLMATYAPLLETLRSGTESNRGRAALE